MKKGDKIIWDSGFGYELGTFVKERGVMHHTSLVNLTTGIVQGEVSHSISEILPYSREKQHELNVKYFNTQKQL